MASTILVTGACGNIGQNVLDQLSGLDCNIKALDLPSPSNQAVAEKYPQVAFIWADITDAQAVTAALDGVDTVLHLIGIIPPLSESQPELARRVNVDGMRTLIATMQASDTAKRLIFTSSLAVLGIGQGTDQIYTADMPMVRSDVYSETKIDCEKMIHDSGLVWTILRLAAIPNVDPSAHSIKDIAVSLKMGPNDYVEFCHSRDVARALSNACQLDAALIAEKTFMIGGGEGCRCNGYEFTSIMFTAAGIGALPEHVFSKQPNFYAGWVDSESSQAVLDYQRTSMADYCEEFRQRLGPLRYYSARLFSPLIRLVLMRLAKKINQ